MPKIPSSLAALFRTPSRQPAEVAPRPVEQTRRMFPEGFEVGTATAPFQVEEGLGGSDWGAWERQNNIFGQPRIRGGDLADDGPDFALVNADGTPGGRFREYLQAAKSMGQNTFRFGVEWSRIQPEPGGPYDVNALGLYHAILDECLSLGLSPMVTLQHFTLPQWVNDVDGVDTGLGGWAGQTGVIPGQAPIIAEFEKFAGDMAREFGSKVSRWVTLNEPTGFALAAYMGGVFPGPGYPQPENMRRAMINMAHAHARAYDAIKSAYVDLKAIDPNVPDPLVGISQHIRRYVPSNPNNPRDVAAAKQLDTLANAAQIDAVTVGQADWNADGDLDDADEGREPLLKDRLDFIGINYYTIERVKGFPFPIPLGPFRVRGLPIQQALSMIPVFGPLFRPRPATDMNWEIYPQGMFDTLIWAKERYGNLPIYVTETGMAETRMPRARQARFIVDHIDQALRAREAGVDLRGIIIWSLMDNNEWLEGRWQRLGLLQVDFTDPDRPFVETASAVALRDVMQTGGITPEIRERWTRISYDEAPSTSRWSWLWQWQQRPA